MKMERVLLTMSIISFFLHAACCQSAKGIDEEHARRVILSVVYSISQDEGIKVKELTFDYNDSTQVRTFDGLWATDAEIQWITRGYLAEEYTIKGKIFYNPYAEQFSWKSEEVSRNLRYKPSKLAFDYLPKEEQILFGLGIGTPPRRKTKASQSSAKN